MHDFVAVEERKPEDGQEVEVLRYYGRVSNPGHHAYGCEYGVERTTFTGGHFGCDFVSTGHVTHWRPAKSMEFGQGDSRLRDFLNDQQPTSLTCTCCGKPLDPPLPAYTSTEGVFCSRECATQGEPVA